MHGLSNNYLLTKLEARSPRTTRYYNIGWRKCSRKFDIMINAEKPKTMLTENIKDTLKVSTSREKFLGYIQTILCLYIHGIPLNRKRQQLNRRTCKQRRIGRISQTLYMQVVKKTKIRIEHNVVWRLQCWDHDCACYWNHQGIFRPLTRQSTSKRQL